MASEFPNEQVPNENVGAPPPPPSPLPPPAGGGMIGRIKRLLMSPKTEWPAIDAEPMTVQGILTGWVAPLAAIGPIARLIQGQVFPATFFGVTWRPPVVGAVVTAVLTWLLTIGMTYVWALIIDALAPSFGGTKNPVSALKVAAFSATAGWVAAILGILPFLGLLAIIGALYNIYLLWIGGPMLMRVPQDKAPGFVIVSIIVGFVAVFVAGLIAAALAGAMFAMTPGTGMIGTPGGGSVTIGGTTFDTGKLDAAAASLKAATDKMQADAANGTSSAVASADLQAMLPASVGGFARGDVSTESGGAAGINGSKAEARYTMADKSFTLSVADIGAMGTIATLGGAVNAQSSKTTATGYEKTEMVNGSMVNERWDNQESSGAYSTVVGGRFAIDASGSAPSIDVLKQAVASIDAGKLAGMAK